MNDPETNFGGPEAPPPDLPEDPTLSYKPREWEDSPGEDENSSPQASGGPADETIESDNQDKAAGLGIRIPEGYHLKKLIALGGAGEIWEAEQLSLRREVAIKKIRKKRLKKALGDPSFLNTMYKQFEQEATMAAYLDHPNILPVHDLTLDEEGVPQLSMKRVRGRPWSDLLDHDYRKLSLEDHLAIHIPILLSTAQALAFAHSRGIVHRDIKPSQVMVGDFGEVLLMDWGLGMLYEKESLPRLAAPAPRSAFPTPETASSPAGTPVYMAPEQTQQSAVNVGPWTDVYLLGGTLYFVLTGKPPHPAKKKEETFKLASQGVVAPMEEAAEGKTLPADLKRLVGESLHPNPEKRIQKASEFVARLEDFLSGSSRRRESVAITETVKEDAETAHKNYRYYVDTLGALSNARELWPGNPEIPSLYRQNLVEYTEAAMNNGDLVMARALTRQLEPGETRDRLLEEVERKEDKARRSEKQKRFAQTAASILFILIIIFALAAIKQAHEANVARQNTQRALEESRRQAGIAQEMSRKAEREQYFASIGYANATLPEHSIRRITNLLSSAPAHLRQWEWHYLDHSINRQDVLHETAVQILFASISPDEKEIAYGGEGLPLYLWNRETGEVRTFSGAEDKLYMADFSPDGGLIAAASKDGAAYIWDREDGSLVQKLTGHADFVNSVDFSPDGDNLLTSSSDGTAKTWDVETGFLKRTIGGHTSYLRSAFYSENGERILTSSHDRTVRIWNAETGGEIIRIPTNATEGLTFAAYSPDENRIAAASWDGTIQIINRKSEEVVQVLKGHTDSISEVLFSPDGRRLFSASNDGTIGVWDTSSWEMEFRIIGHGASVWALAMPTDGESLLSGSYDRSLRIWDLKELDPRMYSISRESIPEEVRPDRVQILHSDDVSLLSVDDAWMTGNGREFVRVGNDYHQVEQGNVFYSPDNTLKISKDTLGEVRDVETNKVVSLLRTSEVEAAAFSPNGRFLAVAADKVTIWETSKWRQVASIPDSANCRLLCFDSDSKLLVYNLSNSITSVWNMETNAPMLTLGNGEAMGLFALEFSPDSKLLATAHSPSYVVNLWSMEDGKKEGTLLGHSYRIWDIAFNPEGNRIATASWDGTVRLWDTASAREVLIPHRRYDEIILGVAFSEDGSRLFAPTSGRQMEVWDAGDF